MSISLHKHIGILCGMGLDASIFMQKKILEHHDKTCSSCACPKITIFPVNLKKVINFQVYNKMDDYIEYLSDCIFLLEESGCDFVSIAAVTPHIIYDDLVSNCNIPILSIIDNSLKQIQKLDSKDLLVLATSYTNKSGILEKTLKPYGYNLIKPIKEDQEMLDYVIYSKLIKGINTSVEKELIYSLVKNYKTKSILVACTDLSILHLGTNTSYTFIDMLENHAKETLEFALK